MEFINKMERKLGKYAIPNLTAYIIGLFLIGYILSFLAPGVYQAMILDPYRIVYYHEYWRFFTWIVTNPSSFGIFTLIMLFFYYTVGRRLEMAWGQFMYNLYIFGEMLFVTVAVAVLCLIYYFLGGEIQIFNGGAAVLHVTYYMTLSMFLAFADIMGDMKVLLYFVIPIKVKWLAYVDLAFLAFMFLTGDIFEKVVIVAGVANYFIFHFMNKGRRRTFADRRRQKEFKKKTERGKAAFKKRGSFAEPETDYGRSKVIPMPGYPQGITLHKCAICGRTERDSDDLEFRFCSKCNGNYEYCMDHLYTHTHVEFPEQNR